MPRERWSVLAHVSRAGTPLLRLRRRQSRPRPRGRTVRARSPSRAATRCRLVAAAPASRVPRPAPGRPRHRAFLSLTPGSRAALRQGRPRFPRDGAVGNIFVSPAVPLAPVSLVRRPHASARVSAGLRACFSWTSESGRRALHSGFRPFIRCGLFLQTFLFHNWCVLCVCETCLTYGRKEFILRS